MATLQQLQDAFVKADAAGEEKDAQTFADSIRAHPTFQQNARESLESGKYKMGEDFQTLTKDEQLANMSKQVARSLGLKDSEVDVTQGMGTYGRFKLSFQPTEQDKVKHLEDTYGRENIRAVEVGGKTKLLYRDEQETGNQFRAVDEEGTSLADFFGDTAGEVLPTTGAIVGGVAGSFLSPVLGTTAGAAAGYATVAGLQDVVARAVSGEDIRPGEIAKRTAIETAIGIPIDLFTGVGGKVIAKSIGEKAVSKATSELLEAVDDLAGKYGVDTGLTAAQQASPEASLRQSVRAGIDPKGREASALARQRDQILKIDQAIKTGVSSDEPVEAVIARLSDDLLRSIDDYKARIEAENVSIKGADKDIAFEKGRKKRKLTDSAKKKLDMEHMARVDRAEKALNKLRRGKERIEIARGDNVAKMQRSGYEQVSRESEDLYNRAYSLTDTQQANTPVSAVRKVLDSIDDDLVVKDSREDLALRAIRKRINENPADLTFEELDDFVRQFADRVNFKKSRGIGYAELNIKNAYGQINRLWEQAAGKFAKPGSSNLGAGAPAYAAHKKARQHYREKVIPYTEGEQANVLGINKAGKPTIEGEEVVRGALRSSGSVRRALESAADKEAMREELKAAYIESLLRNREVGARIKLDDNIVDALWRGSGEKPSAFKAKVNRMNNRIEKAKDKGSIDKEAIEDTLKEFKPKALAQKERALAERQRLEGEMKAAQQRSLYKIANKKETAPEDIHAFIDDIVDMPAGELKKLMAADGPLTEPQRQSLRRSAIDRLLEDAGAASGKAQRTSKYTNRESLWQPETMAGILNDSKKRAKWDELLGEDVVKDYESMNKWLLNAMEVNDTGSETLARLVATSGSSGQPNLLVVSPGIPRWVGRKILGVLHTSPLTKSMVRRAITERKLDQDTFLKIFYTSMATRRGLEALSDEMAKDPAFGAWVEESLARE